MNNEKFDARDPTQIKVSSPIDTHITKMLAQFLW